MKNTTTIWALFAFIFFVLAYWHYRQSKIKIPTFNPSNKIATLDVSFYNAIAEENKTTLTAFTSEFNNYVSEQNKANQYANRMACWGYIVSSIIAIFSMFI